MLVLGTRSLLVEKAFTVASIDNIDFLKSNVAIIYSGDQHHSWHTTSIQLIQLMPSTLILSIASKVEQSEGFLILEKPQLVKAMKVVIATCTCACTTKLVV